jgi:hypothetical protein
VGSQAKILRHANTENACSANSGKHCAVKYQRGPDTDVKGLDRPMARDRLGHCIGPARQADPCLVLAGAQASTDKQRHGIRRLLCVARCKKLRNPEKNYVRTVHRNSLYEPVVDCCRVHIEREQEVWGLWA